MTGRLNLREEMNHGQRHSTHTHVPEEVYAENSVDAHDAEDDEHGAEHGADGRG